MILGCRRWPTQRQVRAQLKMGWGCTGMRFALSYVYNQTVTVCLLRLCGSVYVRVCARPCLCLCMSVNAMKLGCQRRFFGFDQSLLFLSQEKPCGLSSALTYTHPIHFHLSQNPSRRNGFQRRPRWLLLDQARRRKRGAGPVGPPQPGAEPLLFHLAGKLIICGVNCLFIYIFIYLFIHLFIYLFIYSFIYLFIYLFIHLFIYSFIYSCIHLFIYLIIYLFIYLFIYQTRRQSNRTNHALLPSLPFSFRSSATTATARTDKRRASSGSSKSGG